jgi:hypothetical protein
MPVGTEYWRRNGKQVEKYMKLADDHQSGDWALVHGVIAARLTKADFVDGGGASGTYTFAEQIPIHATVRYSQVVDVVAWSGNTSAVITIGDGSDVDRYNTGTPSVFSTVNLVDVGAVSGTAYHAAAKAPVITVTGNSDFTPIAATAALMARIFYYGK